MELPKYFRDFIQSEEHPSMDDVKAVLRNKQGFAHLFSPGYTKDDLLEIIEMPNNKCRVVIGQPEENPLPDPEIEQLIDSGKALVFIHTSDFKGDRLRIEKFLKKGACLVFEGNKGYTIQYISELIAQAKERLFIVPSEFSLVDVKTLLTKGLTVEVRKDLPFLQTARDVEELIGAGKERLLIQHEGYAISSLLQFLDKGACVKIVNRNGLEEERLLLNLIRKGQQRTLIQINAVDKRDIPRYVQEGAKIVPY